MRPLKKEAKAVGFIGGLLWCVYPSTEANVTIACLSGRSTEIGCGDEYTLALLAIQNIRLIKIVGVSLVNVIFIGITRLCLRLGRLIIWIVEH